MDKTWDVDAWLVACIFLLALAPLHARGQDASEPPSSTPGRPSVERMKNGFVVVPDVRFTEVDGEFASLAGGQVGWMTDRTLFIGFGGYWLTDPDDDRDMAYGGAVVEWALRGDRRFGVSARALIGGGSATLSSPADRTRETRGPMRFAGSFHDRSRPWHGGGGFLVRDDFFVAEPQLNLLWSVKDWLRLGAGVGYRFVGSADPLESRLRGTSGSLSLQLGGS